MQQHISDISTRAADIAAASSIGTAAVVNLANLNTIVQIAAGVAAVLAGIAAAVFHGYKTYDLHLQREKRNGEKNS